jgi:radical SAM protein with 4Fe4S-binding SPASM domain
MDVSATCNLACRDCYTKQSHAPNLMSPQVFRQILNKVVESGAQLEKLHFNWRGEPTTNKRLPEILRIRNELTPGIPIEFHTNGTILTQANSAAIMAEMKADDLLYVSIDGGSPEAHEQNRGEGTWGPTLQGLKWLLEARDALTGSKPTLGIYEICYDRRARYDPELVALSKRCDMWTRVSAISLGGDEEPFALDAVPHGPCFWAGNALCVTATGDVHVCLLSFRPDGKVGNILHDELTTIVDRAKQFRAKLIEIGRANVPHCRNCRKMEADVDEP